MLEKGQQIGRYKILAAIGAGGMGEVFLAEDTELERQIALKVLPSNVANDSERIKRFIQEAKAASALNHPNILTIYEVGIFDNTRFIASEYVEGETLRDKLKGEKLEIQETLNIATQIASAIEAAHSAKIVHRDIKPENIMLRGDNVVKILDFGLAKLTKPQLSENPDTSAPTKVLVKTAEGTVIGTVSYMSPEQAHGKEVNERTDIWSCGVVLYEMICSQMPFTGESANDIIASILKIEPLPVSHYVSNVPKELERIIGKTLRKNPEERYQHIKDLWLDLKDLKQELELEARLERSAVPSKSNERLTNEDLESKTQILERDKLTEAAVAVSTNDLNASNIHSTSNAEYVVSGIKQHKRAVLAVLSILLLSAFAFGYWFFNNGSANTTQIDSIAVLPFENGSNDPNLDYLSDGLSESLIDKLSQLPQLKVIARNSSFKYRGANIDLQEVANKLSVRAVVMGKVIRLGDNLTMRVEMIDVVENRQLWSEQYNRKSSDLLSIQQEIAETASEKLRLKLSGAQEQELAKRETVNPQAYELLLKGRFYFSKSGTDNLKKSAEFMEQAVATDPNYALAYAELSMKYLTLVGNSLVEPRVYLPKAESAAQKAMELDNNLAEAHIARARILVTKWQWQESEQARKRVIELEPNKAEAHSSYAALLGILGRHDEAIAEARRAKELDPLSPFRDYDIAYRLHFARRFDESIAESKKILASDPNLDYVYPIFGYAYAGKEQFKEAINAYQEAIRLEDKSTSIQIYLGAAYARAGERDKAQAILKQLQNTKEYVSPGELAILYGALGDKEAAFASLEKAYAERDLQLQYLKVDPAFDPLRDDLRFQDVIRRVGLPL
jgi:serine/threonine-protein kinase